MECKNCGFKLGKDQNVCPRCGYSFDLDKYKKEQFLKIGASSLGAAGFSGYILKNINNWVNRKGNSNAFASEKTLKANAAPGVKEIINNIINKQSTINSDAARNTISEEANVFSNNSDIDYNIASGDINTSVNSNEINNVNVATDTNKHVIGNDSINIDTSIKNNVKQQLINNIENYEKIEESLANFKLSDIPADEIKPILEQYGYNESEIGRILEVSSNNNEVNRVINEINNERAIEYENLLVKELKNSGMSEDNISRFMDAYKSGNQEELNSIINESYANSMDSVDTVSQEESIREYLSESGLSEEEIARVEEAYRTGGEDKANEVLTELSAKYSAQKEEQVVAELKEKGLTDDEISQVMEAYKSDDENKLEETLTAISDKHAMESEKEMRESLVEAGLTEEEALKVIEVAKTDGEAEAQRVFNEFAEEHVKAAEEQMIAQLKESGLDDATIEKVMQAYREGDNNKVNSIITSVSAAKSASNLESMVSQLREAGVDEATIERIKAAYRRGDQAAINAIYQEISENKFKENLIKMGITNKYDIEVALEAFRNKNDEGIIATVDELSLNYLHFSEDNPDVSIPSPMYVELLASQFGTGGCKFTSTSINRLVHGTVNYENYPKKLNEILNEYVSDGFNKHESSFHLSGFTPDVYRKSVAELYDFLEVLEVDVNTLRNSLIRLFGDETEYFNNVNIEIMNNYTTATGQDNVAFFNMLARYGVTVFGDDNSAQESEIKEFTTGLAVNLAEYYYEMWAQKRLAYSPVLPKLEQIQSKDNATTSIAIFIGQKALDGLIDLEAEFMEGKTLGDYAEERFNQKCRNSDGSIKFNYTNSQADQLSQTLSYCMFFNEKNTSIENGRDTALYTEFVTSVDKYANMQINSWPDPDSYTMDPSCFAYKIMLGAIQKEAYTKDGFWREDTSTEEYRQAVDEYTRALSMGTKLNVSFEEFLESKGFVNPRTELGNQIVETFSKVIGKEPDDRIYRSASYGTNFEEAFYLQRQYYDIVGPEYRASEKDCIDFTNQIQYGLHKNLDLKDQSPEVIAYMKSNPEFSRLFEGEFLELDIIENDEIRDYYEQQITEGILQARRKIEQEKWDSLQYEMGLFNLVVPSEYENGKITELQKEGIDLYLKYAKDPKSSNINYYLEKDLEFENNVTPDGPDYDILGYLKKANPANYQELYKDFSDNMIKISLESLYTDMQFSEEHQRFLGVLNQEVSDLYDWYKRNEQELTHYGFELGEDGNMNYFATAELINSVSDEERERLDAECEEKYTINHWHCTHLLSEIEPLFKDTTDTIYNQERIIKNNTLKLSNSSEYIDNFQKVCDNCKVKEFVYFGEHDTPHYYYELVDIETGNVIQVSDEEKALIYLIKEQEDGKKYRSNINNKAIKDYIKDIAYLKKDTSDDYDSIIDYLMYKNIDCHNIGNMAEFNNSLIRYANKGFDFEAKRIADFYVSDLAAKIFSSLSGIEISDNTDLIGQFGVFGLTAAAIEWLLDDIVIPSIYGVGGFCKNVCYALSDTVMAATGNEDKIDFSPSLMDQVFSNVISYYKENGGPLKLDYYITQASVSIGNQAIPIAVSCIPGCQPLGMALLGMSAYGGTLHSTLQEFLNDGNDKTGVLNAILYASIDAAAEMFLERFLGAMPGLSKAGSSLTGDALGSIFTNLSSEVGFAALFKDITGEMVEESLQEFLSPFFKDVATFDVFRAIGKDGLVDYLGNYFDNTDWGAIKDAAIIAMFSSGMINGVRKAPNIVKSLVDTKGQSSGFYDYLDLQRKAMEQAGFSKEAIEQQYLTNKAAVLNNPSLLNTLSENIMNDSNFQNDFNNWKNSLFEDDVRSELSELDYARMKAIQSISFDTTGLEMQLNNNNSLIIDLQTQLLYDQNNTSLINQINNLNNINLQLNEQINEIRFNAQETINTNLKTLNDLQIELDELNNKLKNAVGDDVVSINERITNVENQMINLQANNNIITLSLNDNVETLESFVNGYNEVINDLENQRDMKGLTDQTRQVVNNQIDLLKQEQTRITERLTTAREDLATSLATEEANLIKAVVAIEELNELDISKKTAFAQEQYQKVFGELDGIKEKLKYVQDEIGTLEEKGVKVEGRITYEDVVKANAEENAKLDVIFSEFAPKPLTDVNGNEETVQTESPSNTTEEVTAPKTETTSQVFTKQMSAVITPLIMKFGFKINDIVDTNGNITHNMGPSIGRVLTLLGEDNNRLTVQLNENVNTQTDVDTDTNINGDIQQRIEANNSAISNLTSLMAQFGINENSPLTSLMEKMQFNKMQLEELRHQMSENTADIKGSSISAEDASQEIKWNTEEIINSDLSFEEKAKALSKVRINIMIQSSLGYRGIMDENLQMDTFEGFKTKNGTISFEEVINYYENGINTEEIQSMLGDSSKSYSEVIFEYEKLADAFPNLDIVVNDINLDGYVLGPLRLNEIIKVLDHQREKLAFDLINSTDGIINSNGHAIEVPGLGKTLANILIGNLQFIDAIKKVNPNSQEFSDLIKGIKELRSYNPNMSDKDVLLNVTEAIGNLKNEALLNLKGKEATLYDGTKVTIIAPNSEVSNQMFTELQRIYAEIPAFARMGINNIRLCANLESPFNLHSSLAYYDDINYGFISLASAGNGVINFWNVLGRSDSLTKDTLAHESGHIFDRLINRFVYGNNNNNLWSEVSTEWQEAKQADGNKVSDYGETKFCEDLAESVMMYLTDQENFYRLHPNRAALLNKMILSLLNTTEFKNFMATGDITVDNTNPTLAQSIDVNESRPSVAGVINNSEVSDVLTPKITLTDIAQMAKDSLSRITQSIMNKLGIPNKTQVVENVVAAIKSPEISLNELGINKSNIDFVLDSLSTEEKMSLFDSIYTRLSKGETINNKVYNAIFSSNVFSADSQFARTYLHHFLETITPGDTRLADKVSSIYDNARKSTINQNLSNLFSYCDHTESHTLQVAFLTLKALNSISNEVSQTGNSNYSAMTEMDYKEMFVAGLLHDLGMASGSLESAGIEIMHGVNGYLVLDENGDLITTAKDLDFLDDGLADVIRENHTLNSALAILSMREQLELAGLNADRLAMICFSHSKSNSGVGSLIEASDWALCVEKIQKGVEMYNSHSNARKLVFDLSSIGEMQDEKVTTVSKQKYKYKGEKLYKEATVNNIIFSDNFVSKMATKAFSLRVGDAFVSKAKIQLDTPITWTFNGQTYSADEAILTQTGLYMLYDKSKKVFFENIQDGADSETSDYAAFAYFRLNENGELVPCMLKERKATIDDKERIIKYFDPNATFAKDKNGAYIFTSEENALMATMGKAKRTIEINGKEVELKITDQNYYIEEVKNGPTNYYVKSNGKAVLRYSTETVDGVDKHYYYGQDGKVEITKSELDQTIGSTIPVSTGQFLAGESNVSYEFYQGIFENKTKNTKIKGLISEMIVNRHDSFVYNALSKGIEERLGELKGANETERIVNIKFADDSFDEMFSVESDINGDVQLIPKNEYGKIYLDMISSYAKNSNYEELKIFIEGYKVMKS